MNTTTLLNYDEDECEERERVECPRCGMSTDLDGFLCCDCAEKID